MLLFTRRQERTMSYQMDPKLIYRMPSHFGPGLGPRQGRDDGPYACKEAPRTVSLGITFLSNREQLQAILPPGFTVGKEPLVTISATTMKEIEWLAGRGYNVLGVNISSVFQGKKDRAVGNFLLVLWENMCDPIVTGRDELGYAKIWAELPDIQIFHGTARATASWMGFNFLEMEVGSLEQKELPQNAPQPKNVDENGTLHGTMHYKYIPRTGDWGKVDVEYPVITPIERPNAKVLEYHTGKGKITWNRPTWEQIPTQYHIVHGLADLEIVEMRDAFVTRGIGDKSLRDQHILY